jgi:hypothetical protein
MLQIFVDNFMAIAPSQLPSLINQKWMEKPMFYEEFTLLTFNLPKTYSVEEIMDMFEEQMEIIPLYHKVSSNYTSFGHSCAAYSNPDFNHMYKINAATDGKGVVSSVSVTIYDSLEMMYGDVNQDVELNSKTGYFKYKREKAEILANFI